MARIYIVSGVNSTHFVNTKREATSLRPGGDEPEQVEVCDAADVCQVLYDDLERQELEIRKLRILLTALYDEATDARATPIGRAVLIAIRKYDPEAARQMSPRE